MKDSKVDGKGVFGYTESVVSYWERGKYMRFVDLIEKKKLGQVLEKTEIEEWIRGYVAGEIPDYQVSALLMAICFMGMNREETLNLTMAMMNSGDLMDLSSINGMKADKHSTGGVGDKTSLVLGPMVAACGVPVAKMSGRGLGFTGGTIDKLESIDGFHVNLEKEKFIEHVNNIGIAIVGQSGNLVPADKKLYGLRDVTGTVNSIPLIASSVMSKKLAAGADVIVLDVKYGNGAFMKTPESARELAEEMIEIGVGMGRRVRAMISSMEAPLGLAIGNALEVAEAVDTLCGKGPKDLEEVCLMAGSLMLVETGMASELKEARLMLEDVLHSGKALEKFAEMVEAQGGNKAQILNPDLLPKADKCTCLLSPKTGYVKEAKAMTLGNLAMEIGAGRSKKEDVIQMDVGIVLHKKTGDFVEKDECLAKIYHREPLSEDWLQRCLDAFVITDGQPTIPPLIYDVL